MLEYHLSVMVMIISSSDTIPNPNMAGNGHFGEYRLRYSVYHAGDEELSHAAPFIGLVVISYFFFAVEFTQYHGKQIVIDVIEYIGNQ